MTAADYVCFFDLGFLQPNDMFLGNDQYVGRSFGIDVFEGESVFVFVHLLGGNFTGNDSAEQAVRHRDPSSVFGRSRRCSAASMVAGTMEAREVGLKAADRGLKAGI